VETYSLPEWAARKTLGELGRACEEIAANIPLGDALAYWPLVVLKITATGIAQVLPDTPTVSQIEGVDPETARILDALDFARRTDDGASAASRFLYFYFCKYGAQSSPHGVVFLWPGAMGQDP
jgi:hypothetical protein